MGLERDYFKRKTDQMARLLGKILTDFMGNKNAENIEATIQTLKTEAGVAIDDLLKTNASKLIEALEKQNLDNHHIEILGDIMYEIARSKEQLNQNPETIIQLYKSCLIIFDHVSSIDKTYSFERYNKVKYIKVFLGE